MEVALFIAGLILGGIATGVIMLSIIKPAGTLHVVNGRPAQFDIENWDVLHKKKRAYIKIDRKTDDSQE